MTNLSTRSLFTFTWHTFCDNKQMTVTTHCLDVLRLDSGQWKALRHNGQGETATGENPAEAVLNLLL